MAHPSFWVRRCRGGHFCSHCNTLLLHRQLQVWFKGECP